MKPARQPPHPPQETTPATPRTPSEVDIKTLLDIHNLQNPGTPLAITDILNLPGLARLQGGTNMKPPLKGVGGDDHDHDEMADYIDDDNDEDDDNEDEDDDEAWDDIHEAARARRARHLVDAAEALRLSKLAYDPSRPGADTRADADGVALGVVPNHEARRWRERRMRLARYIQFLAGGPDVENNNNNNIIVGGGGGGGDGADDDVPPAVARFLDLGFERPGVPVAAPVVRGGRARTCMGWYVKGGRPAPDGVELRRRRRGPVVGGGGGVGLPSDEDLRALDALYEGIGTPPPLKGQGGRGQQKKGVVKAGKLCSIWWPHFLVLVRDTKAREGKLTQHRSSPDPSNPPAVWTTSTTPTESTTTAASSSA